MLIIGAGGLAAQMFDELVALKLQNIAFWSETETRYFFIRDKFPLMDSDEKVSKYFEDVAKSFVLCIGDSKVRRLIGEKFIRLGGKLTSYLSPFSTISPYATIGDGSVILSRVEIEAGVSLGEGCLINKTANIGHGCEIGDYCEIAPGVIITGDVEIGENSLVGTGTIILPKVRIGKNVIISAGSIVKTNIPDNAVVAGEKAVVKFYRNEESKHLHDSL